MNISLHVHGWLPSFDAMFVALVVLVFFAVVFAGPVVVATQRGRTRLMFTPLVPLADFLELGQEPLPQHEEVFWFAPRLWRLRAYLTAERLHTSSPWLVFEWRPPVYGAQGEEQTYRAWALVAGLMVISLVGGHHALVMARAL